MKFKRWPDWLKDLYRSKRGETEHICRLIRSKELNTVCQSAHCPNIGECFERKEATFLILGNICTRNCSFCNIKHGVPLSPDPDEMDRILDAIREMQLEYTVITSVTRDDLSDGGASYFSELTRRIKNTFPSIEVECLIPDMEFKKSGLETLLSAPIDVINHNLETVSCLYDIIRPKANYDNSLSILAFFKEHGFITKSGIMLGLGESRMEIERTIRDISERSVDILTIGQYLQPSLHHYPVQKYYELNEFDEINEFALKCGFKAVLSGPFVRSSYRAKNILIKRS